MRKIFPLSQQFTHLHPAMSYHWPRDVFIAFIAFDNFFKLLNLLFTCLPLHLGREPHEGRAKAVSVTAESIALPSTRPGTELALNKYLLNGWCQKSLSIETKDLGLGSEKPPPCSCPEPVLGQYLAQMPSLTFRHHHNSQTCYRTHRASSTARPAIPGAIPRFYLQREAQTQHWQCLLHRAQPMNEQTTDISKHKSHCLPLPIYSYI